MCACASLCRVGVGRSVCDLRYASGMPVVCNRRCVSYSPNGRATDQALAVPHLVTLCGIAQSGVNTGWLTQAPSDILGFDHA